MALDTSQTHAFARSDRSFLGVWWWTMDRWLFGAAMVLVILGILLSFGNSPAAAARMNFNDPFHFAIRQTIFGLGGAAVMLAVSLLSPRHIRRTAFIVYGVAIAAMIGFDFAAGRLRRRWAH